MRECASFSRSTKAHAGALVLGAVFLAVQAGDARAQRASGIQLTPDSGHYLISKDVGGERWAISFNLEARTVTGNVFKADGSPPSFLWCRVTNELPAPNPADTTYTLDCDGASPCAEAPCFDSSWTRIASGIEVKGSFLLPPGTLSSFKGQVQPILNTSCALAGCHAGAAPAQGLNLEPANAYRNIFRVPSTQDDDHRLIEPFDTSTSHLYGKITGVEVGARMPLDAPPLDAAQTQAIADWILEGAANN